jgi:hypothetical protein
MKDKTGFLQSEVEEIAQTAVKIDRLLTQAKDMGHQAQENV